MAAILIASRARKATIILGRPSLKSAAPLALLLLPAQKSQMPHGLAQTLTLTEPLPRASAPSDRLLVDLNRLTISSSTGFSLRETILHSPLAQVRLAHSWLEQLVVFPPSSPQALSVSISKLSTTILMRSPAVSASCRLSLPLLPPHPHPLLPRHPLQLPPPAQGRSFPATRTCLAEPSRPRLLMASLSSFRLQLVSLAQSAPGTDLTSIMARSCIRMEDVVPTTTPARPDTQ